MRVPTSAPFLLFAAVAAATTVRPTSASAATTTITASSVEQEATAAGDDFLPTVPNADFLESLSSLPPCPSWGSGGGVDGAKDDQLGLQRPAEHSPSSCDPSDTVTANTYLTQSRHATQQQYATVGYSLGTAGPIQRTWVCPESDDVSKMNGRDDAAGDDDGSMGLRTRFIVRNSSSGPVSVGWVNPDRDNVEVSPYDNSVTPPHADPNAVLAPGEFRVVEAHHGHVFHVRELKRADGSSGSGSRSGEGEGEGGTDDNGGDGGSGGSGQGLVAGRILLRKKAGLLPIRNRAGVDFECPTDVAMRKLQDFVKDQKRKSKLDGANATEEGLRGLLDATSESDLLAMAEEEPEVKPGKTVDESHELHTTDWKVTCNSLYVDFVNRVGCPVDVYFAGAVPEQVEEEEDDGIMSDALPLKVVQGPPTCRESFSFHLGINPQPKDYVTEWDSSVRPEGTHLSHKFVARLHHDPNIVLDEIVIRADVVRDCPERRAGTATVGAVGEALAVGEGRTVRVTDGTEAKGGDGGDGEGMAVSSSGGQRLLDKDKGEKIVWASNLTDEALATILNVKEYRRVPARDGT